MFQLMQSEMEELVANCDRFRTKELYHFGASLKDLGRRYCAVSKMDAAFIPSILARI